MPPRRLATAIAAALAIAAAVIVLLAGNGAAPEHSPAPATAPAVRAAYHPASAPRNRARAARALGRAGIVATDRRTGGVRFAGRLDGFLTGRSNADAADIALGYVASHRRIFGLRARDVRRLELADRSTSHGMTLLRFTQEVGGVPLLEGSLRAAVTEDGRLVNVTGGARPGLPRPGRPQLDAAAATAIAARATGGSAAGAQTTLVMTAATGRVRLAWRVLRPQGGAYYDQLIDAATGEEISRRDRIDHAVPGLVYDTFPGAPTGGTARTMDLEPYLSPAAVALEGPRARVWADIDGDDVEDPAERVLKSPQGDFKYTRSPYRDDPACPPVGCAWSPTFANSYTTNSKQAGVQLFSLIAQFGDHLRAAPIGFDGFRAGIPGVDNDPVMGNVMDGAAGPNGVPMPGHLNNAGMWTPPEGQSPRIDAFLFYATDKYPALDPVDDASVVYHEYTHGLIARTVVDALGWGATNLRQPMALNEALADFFSLDYLAGKGLINDTAADGEVMVGSHLYKAGSGRTEAIDCPVVTSSDNCRFQGLIPGGLTYDDYGNVGANGPEEHYDGEILAQAMWQLRGDLLAAHGPDEGENRTRSLAYTALQLAPPEPTFLDYRNALLQADRVLRQGQDAQRIWKVFGERGMGWYASTKDSDDADPVADDRPGPTGITGEGTLSGIVTDRDTGAALANVKVALGGHTTQNASTPGPYDTTTDADGRYRFTHVPAGEYPHLIARRTGYAEQITEHVDVHGAARTDIRVRRNWADVNAGATIAGTDAGPVNGCRPPNLADGDRMTGFATTLSGVDERYVDVALPTPVRVTGFGIDPTPRTNIEAATKGRCEVNGGARATRVRIEVAADQGGPWKEVVRENVDDAHAHHLTEFRPAAPVDDVRFVRLHMIHPVNQTAVPRVLAFAELQVYAAAKRPPRAIFDYGPKPLDVDQQATFDGARSRPGDSPIVKWEWDLDGNGSYETDTHTATATHTYTATGNYHVGLRVTDADGETDELRALVLVARGYEIFDLGTTEPDDAGGAFATTITPRGSVIATMGHQGVTDQMPGRYDGSAVQPLPLPANRVFGTVWDGNDAGQTVGTAYPARQFLQVDAVMWNGTVPTQLGTLGGSSATAVGVNANGWTVGWAYDAKEQPRGYLKRLGNPMVDVQAEANVAAAQRTTMKLVKINDAGTAVGCSGYTRAGEGCDDTVAYDGVTRTLTKLPDLGFWSGATNISADGRTITGVMGDAGRIGRATIWRDGQPQVIRVLGGDSQALAVNAAGTVVGHIGRLTGYGAWMFRDSKVTMLDDLVPDSGWELTEANDISDRDEIVGLGTIGGKEHAFQLNLGPCRVCVTDVQLEDHDLPSGAWQDVGADGTVDGNAVRVRVRVANHDDQPHVFQVKARDETRKEAIGDQPPTVSLNPGEEQWVELDWDTEGLAWKDGKPDADHVLRVRAVLGHTIYNGRSVVLRVRPRPVVLVPGALEDALAWKPYAEVLQRANPEWEAHPVTGLDTGRWSDLGHAPDTLDRHSEVLQAFVAGVRADEDAEHVDLVAHGLGGLIARQWIQDGMPDGVAEHLVQLGTPNLGTPCAEALEGGPFYDLRRDVMAGFNARVTDRRGVEFAAYAGETESYTCVRGTEGGDGFTPLSSARWTIEDTEKGEVGHVDMPGSGAIFTDFVKPRLTGEQGAPSAAAARSAAAEAPPAVTPRSHQLLAQRIATMAAGGTELVPLGVEGGSQLDVTLLAPPQVKAALVAPDGSTADTADAGTTRALTAGDPAPGRWNVRLSSTADAPVQAAVSAALRDDPWTLDLRRGRPAADGSLPMIAAVSRFDRRVTDGTVTIEVQRRGAAPAAVTMTDDGRHGDGLPGDGCYGAAPLVEPGEAILRLRVKRAGAERLRASWTSIPAGDGAGRAPLCPGLRGRNGEIAFAQNNLGWGTVDPQDVVGSLPLSQHIDEASWSADGERLAWAGGFDVYVGKADGTEPVQVAGGDEVYRARPDWSPDGTRLVYDKDCPGGAVSSLHLRSQIVVLDLATGAEHVVTAGAEPAWSPDGETLAFIRPGSASDLDTDLWTVGVDDGRLERVTSIGGGVAEPVWAPSGDKIAFSRHDSYSRETAFGADREIYVADAAGGGVRNLTNDDEEAGFGRPDMRDEAPSWSPDGRRIAFVSTRGEPNGPSGWPNTSQIWEMRPDGTGLRKRTSTPTYKLATAWRAVEFLGSVSAPRCFDLDVKVTRDVPITVPLDCTDDNGDALTLAITEAPAHGTLGEIREDGRIRYTPAAGFTGDDGFTYTASDGRETSAPARARITVAAPPQPPPPPPPPPPAGHYGGGGYVGGGSSGGGGSHGDDDSGHGPVVTIPGDCTVDPRTNSCIVVVPCQPGGDITGCSGRWFQAPAKRARASAFTAAAGKRGQLLKAGRLRIPAGKSGKMRLTLTPKGRAQLRHKRKLVIRVQFRLTAGGQVLQSSTKRIVFRARSRH